MKETDINELIDAYLKKRLSIEDRDRLTKLRAVDPSIEQRISDSEETYKFLQYSRYRKLKTQLKEIDQRERPGGGSHRKYLLTLSVLIVMSVLYWLYMIHCFSPQRLAEKYFSRISEYAFEKNLTRDELNVLNQAERLFMNDDFQNAAGLYQQYSTLSGKTFSANAKWNFMMCRLAIEGPTDNWKEEAKQLMLILRGPLKQKCKNLLSILDSSFYQELMKNHSNRFSALKPRLI